ncbi:MAG: carboxypeptidase-like regulatory domain-containing protein [Flavobacteriaceae bacterium]
MKQALLFFLAVFAIIGVNAQSVSRVEVSGKVSSSSDEVEAITIFNKSNNRGTITNFNGEFTIAVAVNDILEISALQFETKVITITQEVVNSKLLQIVLIEEINTLDAVLLRAGLSGNLAVDITEAKKRPNIAIDLGNMDAFRFYEDKAFDNLVVSNHLNSMMNKGMLYNGPSLGAIIGLFVKPKKRNTSALETIDKSIPKSITDVYPNKILSKKFNIPENQVEAFIGFLEQGEFPQDLLKRENEFQLTDYLLQQKRLFLKTLQVED